MEEPTIIGIPPNERPVRYMIVIEPDLWKPISKTTEDGQYAFAKLTPDFVDFLKKKGIRSIDYKYQHQLRMKPNVVVSVASNDDSRVGRTGVDVGVFYLPVLRGDDLDVMKQQIKDEYQIFKKHIEEYILRKRAGESLTTKLALGKEQGPGQGKEKDVLGQVVAMGYTTGEKGSSDIVLERLKTKLKGGRKTRGKRKGKKASRKTRRRS